jgi:tetratricopeptide (TPR) repeat protein
MTMTSEAQPPKADRKKIIKHRAASKPPTYYFDEGVRLIDTGLPDKAIPLLERAVQEQPTWADYRFQIARAYHQADRIDEAIAQLEEAININPNYTMALNDLGILFGLKGDYEKASEIHRRAVQSFSYRASDKDPFEVQEEAAVQFNLGIDLHKKGKIEEARKAFEKAANLKPRDLEILYNLAVEDFNQGRLDDVDSRLKQLLREDPNNVSSLALAADVALEKQNYTRAQTLLEKAIQNAPDYPDLHLRMGIVFLEEEVYSESIWFLERAIELNDEFTEAYFYLGNAYLGENLLAEAEDSINRAMDLSENGDPFLNLCMAEIQEKRNQPEKAIEEFKKVTSDPTCGEFAKDQISRLQRVSGGG